MNALNYQLYNQIRKKSLENLDLLLEVLRPILSESKKLSIILLLLTWRMKVPRILTQADVHVLKTRYRLKILYSRIFLQMFTKILAIKLVITNIFPTFARKINFKHKLRRNPLKTASSTPKTAKRARLT